MTDALDEMGNLLDAADDSPMWSWPGSARAWVMLPTSTWTTSTRSTRICSARTAGMTTSLACGPRIRSTSTRSRAPAATGRSPSTTTCGPWTATGRTSPRPGASPSAPPPAEGVETIQDVLRTFIAMDPPEHTEQRKTVRSVAAPSNVRNVEPLIRERTAGVLDALPEGETFDWVDTVSKELTSLMLATLFDFPLEDRRKLTRWSDIVFAVPEPGGLVESNEQKIHELIEMAGYFGELWEERRGGDGVRPHHHARQRRGNEGHGPPRAHGQPAAADRRRQRHHPQLDDRERVRPQHLPRPVRQAERRPLARSAVSSPRSSAGRPRCPTCGAPPTTTARSAARQIRKDDQILMWYLSANRDEDVFDNADAIDLERPNADRHLSFGYGIHYCMGSRLAELQLRVLWEEILPRFERIDIQDEPERVFSTFVKGYTKLPVTVTRR